MSGIGLPDFSIDREFAEDDDNTEEQEPVKSELTSQQAPVLQSNWDHVDQAFCVSECSSGNDAPRYNLTYLGRAPPPHPPGCKSTSVSSSASIFASSHFDASFAQGSAPVEQVLFGGLEVDPSCVHSTAPMASPQQAASFSPYSLTSFSNPTSIAASTSYPHGAPSQGEYQSVDHLNTAVHNVYHGVSPQHHIQPCICSRSVSATDFPPGPGTIAINSDSQNYNYQFYREADPASLSETRSYMSAPNPELYGAANSSLHLTTDQSPSVRSAENRMDGFTLYSPCPSPPPSDLSQPISHSSSSSDNIPAHVSISSYQFHPSAVFHTGLPSAPSYPASHFASTAVVDTPATKRCSVLRNGFPTPIRHTPLQDKDIGKGVAFSNIRCGALDDGPNVKTVRLMDQYLELHISTADNDPLKRELFRASQVASMISNPDGERYSRGTFENRIARLIKRKKDLEGVYKASSHSNTTVFACHKQNGALYVSFEILEEICKSGIRKRSGKQTRKSPVASSMKKRS